MLTIDRHCPLTPRELDVLERLFRDVVHRHPGITGFALKGSAWNPSTRLPGADIDVNWCGQPDWDAGDPLFKSRSVCNHEGVLLDFSIWFWHDLANPDTASLTTAVSLDAAHILWERDGAFSGPQRAIRERLTSPAWITDKLSAEFESVRRSIEKWRDPAARALPGHGWDLARMVGSAWGQAILSSCALRPPSAGRKGLLEIVTLSRELAVPWFGETALANMGVAAATAADAERWLAENQRLRDALPPTVDRLEIDYYLTGARVMIDRGHPRESIHPAWRARQLLRQLHADGPSAPDAAASAEALARELRFDDAGTVTARVEAAHAALLRLEQETPRLLAHLHAALAERARFTATPPRA